MILRLSNWIVRLCEKSEVRRTGLSLVRGSARLNASHSRRSVSKAEQRQIIWKPCRAIETDFSMNSKDLKILDTWQSRWTSVRARSTSCYSVTRMFVERTDSTSGRSRDRNILSRNLYL